MKSCPTEMKEIQGQVRNLIVFRFCSGGYGHRPGYVAILEWWRPYEIR